EPEHPSSSHSSLLTAGRGRGSPAPPNRYGLVSVDGVAWLVAPPGLEPRGHLRRRQGPGRSQSHGVAPPRRRAPHEAAVAPRRLALLPRTKSGRTHSKLWGCRSKTLTPTPEPAGYCAGDVAGERGDRAQGDGSVESA